MAGGMLGIAVSGLMAFQRSIETTSNNIANVNTEGYSRQRVELDTRAPHYSGGGYVGSGVNITNIARSYDQFVNGQLRSSTSAFGEVDSFKSFASQVDNLLGDPSTGMEPAIEGFFKAANDVANDPSSTTARAVMLDEANGLSHRFSVVNGRMEELRDQVNSDVKSTVKTINSYSKAIADLNKDISSALGRANGEQQPNDLMDKRDLILTKLSELVDITVLPQVSGMASVVMKNGQPLVMDAQEYNLGTQGNEFDPTKLEITLEPVNGPPQIVTQQLTGGKLTGTVRFRDEILDPAQQKLGAIAAAIAMELNAVHKNGYDLDGNLGEPLFKFSGLNEVPALSVTSNTGSATLTAAFGNNSANLDTSDYLLKYDATGYTLTRMADDNVIPLTATGSPAILTATNPSDQLPGITLEIDSTPNVGDQFFIRPSYRAAANLTVNVTDPRKIAAASSLAPDGVTALPGDNRNMLKLADLMNDSAMFGNSATFQEAYAQVVSKVGGLTHSANINAAAQSALLERATEDRENISGVNLDEEAANLIKFQQSYQAAAQSISTASSLFDSLINAVR
ncbi:MAG: flagellar hook-associated protein FlgK [Methylococcaceae bacterium]|nr:flagellar hook-associated protein FlgK [Methylococcaceae bacterium]